MIGRIMEKGATMRGNWKWLMAAALAICAAPSQAVSYKLAGSVVGAGGTPSAGLTRPHKVIGAAGQSMVGTSEGPSFILDHGFWSAGGSRVVAVDPPGPGPMPGSLPARLGFGENIPNTPP